MKKDIHPPEVENVAIAVVKELNEQEETEWNVYVINLNDYDLEGVLVTSKGYGAMNEEEVKTTVLRHYLDTVPEKSHKKIEPILDNLFGLNNEYWLSFFANKMMYDKKYIFLPETIIDENLTLIPIINKKGVMIK
jgi:hypothetical protein